MWLLQCFVLSPSLQGFNRHGDVALGDMASAGDGWAQPQGAFPAQRIPWLWDHSQSSLVSPQNEEVRFIESQLESHKQKYFELQAFTRSLILAIKADDKEQQQVNPGAGLISVFHIRKCLSFCVVSLPWLYSRGSNYDRKTQIISSQAQVLIKKLK